MEAEHVVLLVHVSAFYTGIGCNRIQDADDFLNVILYNKAS